MFIIQYLNINKNSLTMRSENQVIFLLTFFNKIYFLNIYITKIFISIYIGYKFGLINLIKSNYYGEVSDIP